MRQRLAAVMAADIVGYTRLMAADQAGTFQALRVFRAEVLHPSIAEHDGALIKDMGDGWLAEFQSVSDAVKCAFQVQDGLSRQELLRLRIGINIGDVLHEDGDIFGDGVNVAARLQEVAPGGGIAISGAAYDVIDGTLAPKFADAGLHELKNVSRPINLWIYAPSHDGIGVVTTQVQEKLTRLVICPAGLSPGDKPLKDLGDAITEDAMRMLSSSDWIAPRISPSSEEADYVLSTHMRGRGDQLRLEATLTAALGTTIWKGVFDGTMSESFDLQDRVGRQISAEVFGAITDSERTRLFEKPDDGLSARECLECAVLEFFEISNDAVSSSLGYVEQAIRRDPDYAPAYVQGVRCLLAAVAVGYRTGVGSWLQSLPHWIDRTGSVTGNHIRVRLYKAIWSYMQDRDGGHLQGQVTEVLEQAPLDPDALCLGGWAYVWLGQPAPAIACFQKFERIGPFNALTIAVEAGLAMAYTQAGRDPEAIDQAQRILRQTRDFSVPFRALASASAHQGDLAEARFAVAEALRVVPGDTLPALQQRLGLSDTDPNRRFYEGLRLAGFPEN